MERAHHMRNIQKNDGTRNKNKNVVVKFYEDKYLQTKYTIQGKIFLNKDSGVDSQHS